MPQEWIHSRLLRLLGRNWVVLILVLVIVSLLIHSLSEANWVEDDRGLIAAFIVGIVLGWWLARSRFSGTFAVVYLIVMGGIAAVAAVANFGPALGRIFTSQPGEVVNDLNLRAYQFYLRVSGWVDTLQAGQNVEDPGPFMLLLGFILVLCGAWLMWALLRQRRAFNALLPVGILLAINVHMSRQSLLDYWAFLFCSLLLVIWAAYSRQHEDWRRRGVDHPEQLGLDWGMAAGAAALIIVLVARAAPLIGTPEGWQAISEWLASTREQTSDTAERLFSGVNPPPAVDETPAVYINTPNLSEIGRPLDRGSQTVMWVSTSDPPSLPPEIVMDAPVQPRQIHYWRNTIYSLYSGRGWEEAPLAAENYTQPEDEIAPLEGRYLLRQEIEVVARHNGELFSTNDPVQTTSGVALRETLADGSRLVRGNDPTYQVISQATRVTANQLAAAPVTYPEAVLREYLQIPPGLPARVNRLSRRLAEGAENPYEKVLNIQSYLRQNYAYDLDVEPAPASWDVVDHFLFEQQRGFCSHYATAMAVMLRSVDVPARVAAGYAMGDYDRERNAYRVPRSAAHAWVEIYFPGFGWIEFEPTAFRTVIEYPAENPDLAGPAPSIEITDEPATGAQPVVVVLVVFAVLGLLALPFLLARMFFTRGQAPPIQVDLLYRRMRRALGWAGLEAVPSVTPDEYLNLYNGRLEPYNQLQQALYQATRLYREMIYSPHPPDAGRVRMASQLWQRSLGEWLALWLRARWDRIRQQLARS